ncbi:MAG: RNA 2',3'-cyclic phosphodiesterase [Gemmatimonadota bacterium]
MRLFLAITLPDPLKHAIYTATEPLRNAAPAIRWVASEQLHITLKFLGDVPEDGLPPIQSVLTRVASASAAFRMEIGGIGAFPNLRRPRVVWVGVTESGVLTQLQEQLETAIAPLGFPREARPFHPHLTLGRVSPEVPAEQLRSSERAASGIEYKDTMLVGSAELMLSRLSPKGARYEVLSSAPLKGGS